MQEFKKKKTEPEDFSILLLVVGVWIRHDFADEAIEMHLFYPFINVKLRYIFHGEKRTKKLNFPFKRVLI